MQQQLVETIDYRGMSIAIKVESEANKVFGRADVCAGPEFKGRLALASTQRRPEEVLEKVRCLAKPKVDAWSVAERALQAVSQQGTGMPGAP